MYAAASAISPYIPMLQENNGLTGFVATSARARRAPHGCPEHAPRALVGEGRYGGRRLENNFCVSALRGQSRYRRRNGYAGKESRRATATVGRDLRCKRKPIGRDQ